MIFRMVGRWKTMGKKSKLVSRVDLHHGQSNSSTMTYIMKSNLPDTVWNIMQAGHRYSAPGIDKSYRIVRGQLKTFKLR